MSKRDFVRIADGIKYVTSDPTTDPSTSVKIVNELCNAFSTFNPRFDRERFITACGLDPERVLGPRATRPSESDRLIDQAKRSLA